MKYKHSKIIIMGMGMLFLSLGLSASANPNTSELKDRAVKQGIVSMNTDTTQLLKRQEAAKLYVAISQYYRGATGINDIIKNPSSKCVFSDVVDTNLNRPAITNSCTLGIFRGTEGKFLVDNNLTPSQAIVTLMRVVGGMQSEDVQPRWKSYLDLALKHQIIPIQDIDLINSGVAIDTNKILERIYAIDQSQTLKKDELVQGASVAMFGSGFGGNDTSVVIQTGNDTSVFIQTGTDNISGNTVAAPLITKNPRKGYIRGQHYFMKCMWWCWALWLLALLILLGLLKRLMGRRPHSGTAGSDDRDDLTLIEGIGPRIQGFLYENGITSFSQIARMRPEQISELLEPYGGSFANMYTDLWPAQAALARDGKFDELAAWRKELDNGVEPE